jgi:type IV secretory pathway VirB2 component (pilin)
MGADDQAVTVEERDLTGQELDALVSESSAVKLRPESPPVRPFDLAREQEMIRGRIAWGLVVMLAVLILIAFGTLWFKADQFDQLEKLLTIIFAPVIALVGTATGYYFGGKSAHHDGRG